MELLRELKNMKADTILVSEPKPRGKGVNDVLRSKRSERHYNAKTDYVRAKEKSKANKMMESEEDCCYFHYSVSWDQKNHSGEGPDTTLNHDSGYVVADTKEEAIAKVKKDYGNHSTVRVSKSTKAEYDKHMRD